MVDQFLETGAEKLSYLSEHQEQLRASEYIRMRRLLGDSGRSEEEASLLRGNRLFILSSTHAGLISCLLCRIWHKRQDIIAISNKIGLPDLLVILTCNQNWP